MMTILASVLAAGILTKIGVILIETQIRKISIICGLFFGSGSLIGEFVTGNLTNWFSISTKVILISLLCMLMIYFVLKKANIR